jgi:NAD(P)-dependent dehydrogenase (short-subunit alcohol dehydrogenase family)
VHHPIFVFLCVVLSFIHRNSGIGLYASQLFRATTPESRLILVARNKEKAECAKQEIISLNPPQSPLEDHNIITMACDQTSFKSIHQFCSEVRAWIEGDQIVSDDQDLSTRGGIDLMCLNAAILTAEDAQPQFSEDDIEITFQTNHLGPFLIANLLCDFINPGGRVVVTTSGLHEFSKCDNFVGMTAPASGGLKRRFEMINSEEYNYKKCYAASKLCNVLFCVELNKRLKKRNAIAVCFTPGLIPTSGLFRNQNNWMEAIAKKKAVGMIDTKEWGGCVLAWISLSKEAGGQGGVFWRAPYGISSRGGCFYRDMYIATLCAEAASPANQELLWNLSAELTCISPDLV